METRSLEVCLSRVDKRKDDIGLGVIASAYQELERLKRYTSAALPLCRIYFDIAAELIGEEEVRRRRDVRLASQPNGTNTIEGSEKESVVVPPVMRSLPSEKDLKEICYRFLSEVFRDGTKIDRFDAEISEYWLPHIEYDVVPRMIKALRGNDA